jgi:homeobox-leucine zipper protein
MPPLYFQVCKRSLSGSGGGQSTASPEQFVRAEMLSSGYLVRPCEGGGSIMHIVDHLDLEVGSRNSIAYHRTAEFSSSSY